MDLLHYPIYIYQYALLNLVIQYLIECQQHRDYPLRTKPASNNQVVVHTTLITQCPYSLVYAEPQAHIKIEVRGVILINGG